jgi:hypothetical protein
MESHPLPKAGGAMQNDTAEQPMSPETFAHQLAEARTATLRERLGLLIRLRDSLNLEIARAACLNSVTTSSQLGSDMSAIPAARVR